MSFLKIKDDKKDRPRIQLETQSFDTMVEGAAVIFLIVLLLLPAINYGELPDRIPTHFNAKGIADGFGNKGTIWLLPGLGLLIFIGFTIMNRFPHTFNYPVKITSENAEQQYYLATRLIRALKAAILLMFAMITYGTVNVALGKADSLGSISVLLIVIVIMGITTLYFVKSYQKKK